MNQMKMHLKSNERMNTLNINTKQELEQIIDSFFAFSDLICVSTKKITYLAKETRPETEMILSVERSNEHNSNTSVCILLH